MQMLLRSLAGARLAAVRVLGVVAARARTATPAPPATSQFHGVNSADPHDNFVTGPIAPVGLPTPDSYSTMGCPLIPGA